MDYGETLYVLIPCILLIIVMFNNGSLLVMHSDAWWHMSYANKISVTNQIFLDRSHLSGIELNSISNYFSYLPGWHLNLALLQHSSDLPLTAIWHNLASILATITFISYFLFSKTLVNNNYVAVLSAVLLSLLFGGLNSYFRISPWPGNVSYIIWYFLYFLAFTLLSEFVKSKQNGFFTFLASTYQQDRFSLILAVICCYLILTIHASELLWFGVSFIFYYLLSIYVNHSSTQVQSDLQVLGFPVTLILVVATISYFYQNSQNMNPDLIVCGGQFLVLLWLGLTVRKLNLSDKTTLTVGLLFLVIFFVFNVDFTQVKTLIYPVKEQLNSYGYHHPYKVIGIFGNDLILPQWEHQLREAILFAGLVSAIASCYLLFKNCNRTNLFLFANCFFSLMAITSPYLFTFLNNFTPYTSTYRVHLLIFHPIILACLFYRLFFLVSNQPVIEQYEA